MKRKIGPVDITYCATRCERKNCKRNLGYWEPPTAICSMAYFNANNADMMHTNCEDILYAEEDKI